ncbi:hypothetical protein Bca4012_083340 [Brassica carinata]
MRAWGIQQGCVLCGERDETRDYIFFVCPYTFPVWDKLANRLTGGRTDPDWTTTLQFVCTNSLSYMDKILLKMLFQTCIYYFWRERNEGGIEQVIGQWTKCPKPLIRLFAIGLLLCAVGQITSWLVQCRDGLRYKIKPLEGYSFF